MTRIADHVLKRSGGEGVFALSYYRGKNDVIAEAGRRVIDVVLADR